MSENGIRVRVDPGRRGVLLVPGDRRSAAAASLGAATPPVRGRAAGTSILVRWSDASRLVAIFGAELLWDEDAERAVANRQAVSRAAPRVMSAARALQQGSPKLARDAIGSDCLSVDLDDHQALNVAVMTLPDAWGACIFDEQGTGKTVTVLGAFDRLVERGDADTLLVVAPKSMVAEWQAEFERYAGSLYSVALATGPGKRTALGSGADVVVLNYEAAISLERDLIRFCRRRRAVLVVDESFSVKNPDAQRTLALQRIREWCRRAFVLCGTPAPNRPTDVVSQFDLVDFGRTFEGLGGSFVDIDAERAAVSDTMERRGVFTRNTKSVVLADLPSREFFEVQVDLGPEARRLYDDALVGLVADVEAVDDIGFRRELHNFLERRTALLRICSNPVGLDPTYSETPAKLEALDVLLEDYLARGEKVVIWSYYRASLNAIARRYKQHGLVRIDGSISDTDERREAVRRFQTDDDVRLFLGNPAAAGAGLTLHAARVAVYESLSSQAAHHMQSLDRIHRRGQRRDVEYVTLLCRDTIEPAEYRRLLAKARRQGVLLGDPAEARINRTVFLSELTNRVSSPET